MDKYFTGKSPCKDCPYRTDAPLQKWDKAEFEGVLAGECNVWSNPYLCHKNNGTACKGWLIMQWRNRLPNFRLRIKLIQLQPPENYMKTLRSPVKLYKTVKAMIAANYPELLK